MATAPIRIGTQGWTYTDWNGGFFPDGTRKTDHLALYGKAFDTVEVDSTFYAIPSSETIRGWYDRTPDAFVFSLKLPQAITHDARLRDHAGLTEQFFDRARELRHKLGPVLVQLGPDFGPAELPALADFLPRLPRDLRVAIEFRQRGWVSETVLTLLRDHGVALALVDGPWMPRRWALKLTEHPTASFTYIRWMGPDRAITDHSHVQVDRTRELGEWVAVLPALQSRVDAIYGYVSNYYAGHAPANARELQQRLGLPWRDPATLGDQIGLF